MKRAKSAELAVPALLRQSFSDLWQHKRILLWTVAAVGVPLAFLVGVLRLQADSVVNTYGSFASMFMNVALIWVIMQVKEGNKVTVQQAYYDGTAAAVRFILLAMVLIFELIPLAIGLSIYSNGVAGGSFATSLPERLLLILVWLLLSLPSIFWLSRSIFSVYIIQAPGKRPFQSVRESWRLVRGHTLQVTGRLGVLALTCILLLAVPTVVLLILGSRLAQQDLALAVLQLVSTMLLLPFSNLFAYNLYQALSHDQS